MDSKLRVRFVSESVMYSELIAISNYFGHNFLNKERIKDVSVYGYTMSQLSNYVKEEGFAQWHIHCLAASKLAKIEDLYINMPNDGFSPLIMNVMDLNSSYKACAFVNNDGDMIVYPPCGRVAETTVKQFFAINRVDDIYSFFSTDHTPLVGDYADAKALLRPYEISVSSEALPVAMRYALAVKDYVQMFCDKQELQFDGWVGGDIGGVASFIGEYFFNIGDITFDIDNGCPPGLILNWQLEGIEAHLLNPSVTSFMNYKSYSMGLRYNQLGLPNNPSNKD